MYFDGLSCLGSVLNSHRGRVCAVNFFHYCLNFLCQLEKICNFLSGHATHPFRDPDRCN